MRALWIRRTVIRLYHAYVRASRFADKIWLCRTVGIIIFVLVVASLFFRKFAFREDWNIEAIEKGDTGLTTSHSYWIVVTTIRKPTEALRKLVTLPSWKVVVVGDEKTPMNWRLSSVVYLTVEEQQRMRYSILKHLPLNSYTRKMIGYLFAIESGAEFIYETDDDNFLEKNMTFEFGTQLSNAVMPSTHMRTFNPYSHFGQPTVWPRGFPLDNIGQKQSRDYLMYTQMQRPAVQQALVRGDPDVDAIFRLTRRYSASRLDLEFDNMAPAVVLPAGVFAPFNSQATLFSRSAFWALFLPVSVHARVCDIHRAYWAQPLLWLAGEKLSFVPPSSVQRRNAHVDLEDFRAEQILYTKVPQLLRLLSSWKCSSSSFIWCMKHLTSQLVSDAHWSSNDASLLHAWLQDLSRMDYDFPRVQSVSKDDSVDEKSKVTTLTFYPVSQNTSLPHASNYVNIGQSKKPMIGCQVPKRRKYSLPEDVVLVVKFSLLDELPYLESLYRQVFKRIVYCSSHKHIPGFDISHISTANSSTVSCAELAFRLYQKATGIVATTINYMLKFDSISKSPSSFLLYKFCGLDEDAFCKRTELRNSTSLCAERYQTGYAVMETEPFFYIPSRLRNSFLRLTKLIKNKLQPSRIVPYLLHCDQRARTVTKQVMRIRQPRQLATSQSKLCDDVIAFLT